MDPRITVSDAALCLAKTKAWLLASLKERSLPYVKTASQEHFAHHTARQVFNFSLKPKVMVFQIVKGGTGKTSLVRELAIRASLYGAKVLCVDMDQQGNLSLAFNQNADELPVMIDVLVDHYPINDAIIEVLPGIDLLPSRFDNALLDAVITQKDMPLDQIYREPFQAFKKNYDLILVDCPPSLGQSVSACALAADCIIAPVVPEKFALAGLDMVYQVIQELEQRFQVKLPLGVLLNKFESKTRMSFDTLGYLLRHPKYGAHLLKNTVRYSNDFPKSIAENRSIFDTLKTSIAKEDIDCLTRELLNIHALTSSARMRLEPVVDAV